MGSTGRRHPRRELAGDGKVIEAIEATTRRLRSLDR
jgi:hypothetical protein